MQFKRFSDDFSCFFVVFDVFAEKIVLMIDSFDKIKTLKKRVHVFIVVGKSVGTEIVNTILNVLDRGFYLLHEKS